MNVLIKDTPFKLTAPGSISSEIPITPIQPIVTCLPLGSWEVKEENIVFTCINGWGEG